MWRVSSVGFVGLGAMGKHMAAHVAKRYGAECFVWNRTHARAVEHAAAHGSVAEASVVDVVRKADVIFTCLPTSSVVLGVIEECEAAHAISPVWRKGQIIVDCTSGEPDVSREIGAKLSLHGVHFIDAPVSGGPRGAEAGTVACIVGGDEAPVASVTPLLQMFARKVEHVGPVGAGHAVKAINNILNASHLALAAEGLLALRMANVKPAAALAAINASSGRSLQTEVRLPEEVLTGKFGYGFKLGLMEKDCKIAASLLNRLDTTGEKLLPRTRDLLTAAVAAYGEDADYTCLVRLLEDQAGLTLRDPPVDAATPKE